MYLNICSTNDYSNLQGAPNFQNNQDIKKYFSVGRILSSYIRMLQCLIFSLPECEACTATVIPLLCLCPALSCTNTVYSIIWKDL